MKLASSWAKNEIQLMSQHSFEHKLQWYFQISLEENKKQVYFYALV